MKKSEQNIATRNEIYFIKNLGRWSAAGSRAGRAACLLGYLQGSLSRTNWGDINKVAATKTAATLLLEES